MSRAIRSIALIVCGLSSVVLAASIQNSPHNLSVGGPGQIRATQEARICVFCHTPHNAASNAPLWNRDLSNAVYKIYSSSTLEAKPGQPTGASKLCLSCHDGTVAVGKVRSLSTPIPLTGTSGPLPAGRTSLGTDLSDDHPISFVYDAGIAGQDPQVVHPSQLPRQIQLDANSELQCTACHDPHDNQYGQFLVMDNRESALCVVCHKLDGWTTTSHRTSGATWNGAGLDPWPDSSRATVSANACANCHVAHHAGHPARLLRRAKQEDNCLACHDGSVASTDIAALVLHASSHDVRRTDNVHDPREDAAQAARHVECSDCHNAHAAMSRTANAPLASGALERASGITTTGTAIGQVRYEYEVCYKCHADNPNRTESNITRQITQSNVRLEFDPGSVSYHPIEAAGRNPDVPSLLPPRRTTDMIYCSDCHNSPTSKRAGGSGADGPHGSPHEPILLAEYRTADGTVESPSSYALCYRCHSRSSILSEQSSFPDHRKHIVEERTPCSACHDAHGISSTQGNALSNSHLINFDTTIVQRDSRTGRLAFEDAGRFRGRCYLRCHDKDHSPKGYPEDDD
jgi:predicted CXXCH cytochrome family protein